MEECILSLKLNELSVAERKVVHHNYITRGGAINARLEFAKLEVAAQMRSKMQGWKMRDWKMEHQKCRARKGEKNKLEA